jgi:hypothetical protein
VGVHGITLEGRVEKRNFAGMEGISIPKRRRLGTCRNAS